MNHRSVNQGATQTSPSQRGIPERAGISRIKLESGSKSGSERERPFLEDFNMEHSCSNVTVALKAFSAGSDAGEQARSRNPAALSMNTPSCVYLG